MGAATEVTQAPADSPPNLTENLGWLLSQAAFNLGARLTAALGELGLSPRSYCLLSTALTGTFTQIGLAKAVGLDKTTMVVTLDELETAGLAKRVPAPADRRVRVVAVTKDGERKVAQGKEIVERVEAEVLAEVPARDRKVFLTALARLVA